MSEKPPTPPLITREVLTKANVLGGVLLVAFAICAGIIYVLMGFVGWENGPIRILVALLVAPIIVGIVFMAWWRTNA